MANDSSILYQHYNVDNIFNRSVIAGLLYLLNHKIEYEQVWDDNVVERVTVPFAYNFAHAKDQRFAQDNYTFFGRECFSDKLIDGKFDMLPRFAVSYTGSQIDSGNITNRFVKGKYQKEVDGKVETFVAFIYSIPLTLNFEMEGWIDNYETAFKIEQELRNTFYKNQTFNVLYKGMKIGCCAGFPESDVIGEKTVTYSFEQESNIVKMSFNLAVECYQPCFDESTSIPAEARIEKWGFDVNTYNSKDTPKNKKISVKLNPIDTSVVRRSGDTMYLSWKVESNTAQGYSMALYYIDENKEKHIIDSVLMQNDYEWKIPYYASSIKQPEKFFIDNSLVAVKSAPEILVTANSSGEVDEGCFIITNPGEFSSDGFIQVSLERINSKRKIEIYDGYVGVVSNGILINVIRYESLSDADLQKYNINVSNKKKMKYEISSISRKISVGIYYPLDKEIYDQIDNILII